MATFCITTYIKIYLRIIDMNAPLTFLDMFVNPLYYLFWIEQIWDFSVRTPITLVALATFCITTYLKIGSRVIDMNAPLRFLDMFVNPSCFLFWIEQIWDLSC